MFHVIQPAQGDQFIHHPNNTGPGIRFGIYHRIFGVVHQDGLAPFTWGRDQFNNSNCVHLNVEGTLIHWPDNSNLSKTKVVTSYYSQPSYASPFVSFTRYTCGSVFWTQLLEIGKDATQSFIGYLYSYSHKWLKNEFVIEAKWISALQLRVCMRKKVSRQSDGYVTTQQTQVSYLRYAGATYSQHKDTLYSYGSFNYQPPEWIEPPSAFVSSIRASLIGTTTTFPLPASIIYRRLEKFRLEVQSKDSSSFGQLSIDAVQALKVFDGQLSLLLRDIIGFRDTLLGFIKGVSSLSLNGLASSYLSYRYGLKLTYTDLMKLAGSTRSVMDGKKGYNTSRSRLQRTVDSTTLGVPVDYLYSMKLFVRDYPDWIIEALQKMMVADFFPTLELAWDIIPFSFVVDWFLNIGDYLEALDSNTLLSTYKVLSCCYSRKATIREEFGVLFPDYLGVIEGEVTISYYSRFVSSTPPPFFLDYSTPRSFNHYLEGSALIAQRFRV